MKCTARWENAPAIELSHHPDLLCPHTQQKVTVITGVDPCAVCHSIPRLHRLQFKLGPTKFFEVGGMSQGTRTHFTEDLLAKHSKGLPRSPNSSDKALNASSLVKARKGSRLSARWQTSEGPPKWFVDCSHQDSCPPACRRSFPASKPVQTPAHIPAYLSLPSHLFAHKTSKLLHISTANSTTPCPAHLSLTLHT
jgi:hypothetical protein